MRVAAVIVAAGRGERFGSDLPKQYQLLHGVPLLRHSVLAFAHNADVDAVRVVRDPAHAALCDEAVAGLELLPPVDGGESRQDSVRRGLESLAGEEPPARVLIHDAARPLVSGRCISGVVAALDRHPGAVAAVPVVDSLKRAVDGCVAEDLPREEVWRAQTPQGFHFAPLLAAHRTATDTFSDDVGLARAAGLEVAIVAGDADNLKVTTADDLHRAQRLLAGGGADVRVGQGFDVHRFGPGDHVRLCGIDVAHDAGLAGHSDADVALHALTDALLGSIGADDIGAHFPPGEAQWRDTDSAVFVNHALKLIRERGGVIAHVDVTIVCEAPRIGPHRAAMRTRLAALLGLDESRTSVKATTTERLGFTGRGEGIAAFATASVRLPPA